MVKPVPITNCLKEKVDLFWAKRSTHWEIERSIFGSMLYRIILERVAKHLPEYLRTLDNIIGYFKNRHLKLMGPVTEIWMTNCLPTNYCHANNVPTYLIINGLLGVAYGDDAKHAKVINSYGESIKNNYFRGMNNIVCLGDPRMDHYWDRHT